MNLFFNIRQNHEKFLQFSLCSDSNQEKVLRMSVNYKWRHENWQYPKTLATHSLMLARYFGLHLMKNLWRSYILQLLWTWRDGFGGLDAYGMQCRISNGDMSHEIWIWGLTRWNPGLKKTLCMYGFPQPNSKFFDDSSISFQVCNLMCESRVTIYDNLSRGSALILVGKLKSFCYPRQLEKPPHLLTAFLMGVPSGSSPYIDKHLGENTYTRCQRLFSARMSLG